MTPKPKNEGFKLEPGSKVFNTNGIQVWPKPTAPASNHIQIEKPEGTVEPEWKEPADEGEKRIPIHCPRCEGHLTEHPHGLSCVCAPDAVDCPRRFIAPKERIHHKSKLADHNVIVADLQATLNGLQRDHGEELADAKRHADIRQKDWEYLKVKLAESEKKRTTVIELYGTAELLIAEKDKRIEELTSKCCTQHCEIEAQIQCREDAEAKLADMGKQIKINNIVITRLLGEKEKLERREWVRDVDRKAGR